VGILKESAPYIGKKISTLAIKAYIHENRSRYENKSYKYIIYDIQAKLKQKISSSHYKSWVFSLSYIFIHFI
jgi:uncharacterized protein YeeX (DUF496 family)